MLGCRDDDRPEPSAQGSRASLPNNTTSLARQGGAFKSFIALEPPGLDPLASNSIATFQLASLTYPRLLKFTTGVYPDFPKGTVEGDLAESYELLPDKLTLTFKIRPGLKWDAKAPTNGRVIDASDVVASWNRFARLSPNRYDLLYHADLGAGAAVESVSTPNASTVVFKLKQPDASVLGLFASDRHFYVMPKEAEAGFDPRIEMRGYGPWLLTDNRPGIIKVWSRNPDYYVKGRPFPDTLEQMSVGEYNARLAQFKAGLIWPSVVSPDDLIATMNEKPELVVQRTDSFPVAPSMLGFGYDPAGPWKDERLRQAVSMLIDRETFVSLRSTRDALQANGLPAEPRYHTVVGAGWEGYWSDPRNSRFGAEAGRYYTYDPTTALQLRSAAGFADGLDTLLHYSGGMDYSPSYTRNVEMVSGMLYEGGIRAKLDPRSHADDWLPNYQFAYTQSANVGKPIRGFPGLVIRPAASYPTPQSQLYSTYSRFGSQFHGMTPNGANPQQGDAEVNNAMDAIRKESDLARQQQLTLEFAQMMARKAYDIPVLPFAPVHYSLSWPVIGNLGVYRSWPGGSVNAEANIQLWVDQSQAPLHSPS
ncbi:MAG: ABC transporter substrate-binding protein [Dehalococcoidia bacterium]